MATRSSKLGGSAAASIDYLKDEERTLEYYAEDAPGEGRFETVWGTLGQELGLSAGMTHEKWSDLYAGNWNGQRVVGSGYRKHIDKTTGETVIETGVRTPAIDVVFAAPKGVSELYARARTNDEAAAIGAAVLAAAQVAWTEGVEGHARAARVATKRGADGRTHYDRCLAKLVCTPVLQFTARPTTETLKAGAPADPHLHVHCATFTASKVGNRWYTIDEAAIRRTAEYRDQLFIGELARRLEELGYELDYEDFDTSRNGRINFEPKLSLPKLRTFWSKNHQRSIALRRNFIEEHGRPPLDRELTALMKTTRSKKTDKEMDARPVRSRWLTNARENGLEAPLVAPSRVWLQNRAARLDELHRRLYGPQGLTRKDATFAAETLRTTIAGAAVGLHFSRKELIDIECRIRQDLVPLRVAVDSRHDLLTTRPMLAAERLITSQRRHRAGPRHEPLPRHLVNQVIAEQPHQLEPKQRAGVLAATSSSGWVHIEGYAGSGKTTLLAAVRDAHQRAGSVDDVVVVSTAAATAERTGRSLGLAHFGSVESVVARLGSGELAASERTLWFVDEAAMMDTHRMAKLLGAIGPGRVVLVGDEAQLSAIGAAGWYGESVAEHSSVMLTTVHRHRDKADVDAYEQLRSQHAEVAVADLVSRGRVHIDVDRAAKVDRVMRDYANMRTAGYDASDIRQVIETSNHDVDLYNALVQRDHRIRGEIKGPHLEVHDHQQGRSWRLHEGDQVLFLASYRVGPGRTIRNGTPGVVVAVEPDQQVLRIACPDGVVTVEQDPHWLRQPVGLAYAQHANKIQGGEVKMVQVLPGTSRTATANSAYSQVTRAQHEAHVYLDLETHGDDPLATITAAWSTREHRRSASSYLTKTREVPVPPAAEASRPPNSAGTVITQPNRDDTHSSHHVEMQVDHAPVWIDNAEVVWDEPDVPWDEPGPDEHQRDADGWGRGSGSGIDYGR